MCELINLKHSETHYCIMCYIGGEYKEVISYLLLSVYVSNNVRERYRKRILSKTKSNCQISKSELQTMSQLINFYTGEAEIT